MSEQPMDPVAAQCDAWLAQLRAGLANVDPLPAEPNPRDVYEHAHGLQTDPERWAILPSMEEILAAMLQEKAA